MKVLVVEDRPLEMKLANLVLSAAGYVVSGAEGASQALIALENDLPQVVLLDMSMPGMDGIALTRLIRANADMKHVQIVAVTSYPERYSRADAYAAGCDAYFLKPISTRNLPSYLEEVVNQGGRKELR
jgi:two-component system, cell cycle response regulator DivK